MHGHATVCIGDNAIVLLTNAAKPSRTCLTEATATYSISFTSAALPFIARVLKLCTSQKHWVLCEGYTLATLTAESKEEFSAASSQDLAANYGRNLAAWFIRPSLAMQTDLDQPKEIERACGHP